MATAQTLLKDTHPAVAVEWHPTKNTVALDSVGTNSNKTYHWQGACSHEWEASPNNRTSRRSGCPYCSGRKLLPGFNDLATTHSEVAQYWHPTKNGTLLPSQISAGSSTKVWWLCANGHETLAPPLNRTYNKRDCGVCRGKIVLAGYNDLASKHPRLAELWHPTKNGSLLPTQIIAGSGKKVWWQCKDGHEWEATLNYMTSSDTKGCVICNGWVVNPGVNDLTTLHPNVANTWHPTKNKLKPSQVTPGSNQKIWWQCEEGHEWQATPNRRTNQGSGCPFCSNTRILTGYNDLATTNPVLAAEWHPTKNTKLPNQVAPKAKMYAWWVCKNAHEWKAAVYSRATGIGCPECSRKQFRSKTEQEIETYLKEAGLKVKNTIRTLIPGSEIDLYIPDRKIAVEFNGIYWHSEANGKTKWYHHTKYSVLQTKGIQLIQIWEDDWLTNKNSVLQMLDALILGKPVKNPTTTYRKYITPEWLESNSHLSTITTDNSFAQDALLEAHGYTKKEQIEPVYRYYKSGKPLPAPAIGDLTQTVWDAGKIVWKKSL